MSAINFLLECKNADIIKIEMFLNFMTFESAYKLVISCFETVCLYGNLEVAKMAY